nr:hypothetical protein [Caulobacter sp. CCH9-E1]
MRAAGAKKAISLLDLASGLKTELDARYADSEVTLVAHSMGGLVVRQYLTSELAAGLQPKAARAYLYAVPNCGAPLAEFAAGASINNRHVEFLRPDDEILQRLNSDWLRLDVFKKVPVRHAVAGQDEYVPIPSAKPVGGGEYDFLPSQNHNGIIRPSEPDDIRYVILRKFVLGLSNDVRGESIPRNIHPDPLFDVYSKANEKYYIKRDVDENLSRLMAAGHGWIEGASGTGKTAAITRGMQQLPWRMVQIMLAGYGPVGPVGLLRAMCIEFADLCGGKAPEQSENVADLLKAFRSIAREVPNEIIGILIEEIPIEQSEFDEFASLMLSLAQTLDADPSTRGRVLLFFTSVDGIASSAQCGPKFRERFPVIQLEDWDGKDIERLVILLAESLKRELSAEDVQAIVINAGGSARFVKSLFRRWRNGTANGLDLSRLIEEVKSELAQ